MTAAKNGNLTIKYQRRREDEWVDLGGFDFDKNSDASREKEQGDMQQAILMLKKTDLKTELESI